MLVLILLLPSALPHGFPCALQNKEKYKKVSYHLLLKLSHRYRKNHEIKFILEIILQLYSLQILAGSYRQKTKLF